MLLRDYGLRAVPERLGGMEGSYPAIYYHLQRKCEENEEIEENEEVEEDEEEDEVEGRGMNSWRNAAAQSSVAVSSSPASLSAAVVSSSLARNVDFSLATIVEESFCANTGGHSSTNNNVDDNDDDNADDDDDDDIAGTVDIAVEGDPSTRPCNLDSFGVFSHSSCTNTRNGRHHDVAKYVVYDLCGHVVLNEHDSSKTIRSRLLRLLPTPPA